MSERGISFENNDGHIKAFQGGREVGQIKVNIGASGNAVIADIGVPKEFRKQGIGALLTSEAESYARSQGARKIGALAAPDYLDMLQKRGYNTDAFFAEKDL